MRKYYNQTTKEWYFENGVITRKLSDGSLFSGIPTSSQLTAWGFAEIIEPEPTPAELLERARQNKLADIDAYDSSSNVNEFIINGQSLWLDAPLRQQLRISIDAFKTTGAQTVTKWFNGIEYTFPTDQWITMLNLLEVYAANALNVTEAHKAAVMLLDSIEAIEEYDITADYPEKLIFGSPESDDIEEFEK